jgi:uncharacterized protein YbaR (Trm112 family)
MLGVGNRRSESNLLRLLALDKVALTLICLQGDFYMAVRQDLLDILVCPLCKAPVKLLADSSGLKCQACKRVYPIRDDIPVMLPEEAKIATE